MIDSPRFRTLASSFAPLALAACLGLWTAGSTSGQMVDVAEAFGRVPAEGKSISFEGGGIDLPPGGHLQGIQMRLDPETGRHVVLLSHDSATVAYLAIVEFPADLSAGGRLVGVHRFPGDGRSPPLRHAGGIQLAGDVLAVGLEDNQQKTRSEVQFWNVAKPTRPVRYEHLTIRREGAPMDQTAGAVGIVKRRDEYLVAVANWDSRAIDFYATAGGKQLADPACRFEFVARWRDEAADKEVWRPDRVFGEYQSINLVADTAGNLFLIGTHTAAYDIGDLFALALDAAPEKLLRKLAAKRVRLPRGIHFRYAGGAWLGKDGMAVLSSPRNLEKRARLGIAREGK